MSVYISYNITNSSTHRQFILDDLLFPKPFKNKKEAIQYLKEIHDIPYKGMTRFKFPTNVKKTQKTRKNS